MKITKLQDTKVDINKYLDCVRNKKVRSSTNYGKIGILCDADH